MHKCDINNTKEIEGQGKTVIFAASVLQAMHKKIWEGSDNDRD